MIGNNFRKLYVSTPSVAWSNNHWVTIAGKKRYNLKTGTVHSANSNSKLNKQVFFSWITLLLPFITLSKNNILKIFYESLMSWWFLCNSNRFEMMAKWSQHMKNAKFTVFSATSKHSFSALQLNTTRVSVNKILMNWWSLERTVDEKKWTQFPSIIFYCST